MFCLDPQPQEGLAVLGFILFKITLLKSFIHKLVYENNIKLLIKIIQNGELNLTIIKKMLE
jgi:hypothetical protein